MSQPRRPSLFATALLCCSTFGYGSGAALGAPGQSPSAAGAVAAPAADPLAELLDRPALSAPPATLLAAARGAPASESGYTVLLQDTSIQIEAGRLVRRERAVIALSTASAAREWQELRVSFSPWSQDRPGLRARVISSGAVHELDPRTFSEAPAAEAQAETYGDRRVLRAPMPGVTSGAVLEYESTLRERLPGFSAGHGMYVSFGRTDAPVLRARLTVDIDATLPLRHVARLLPGLRTERREAGDRVRWTFLSGPHPKLPEPEPFLPPEVPPRPYVALSTARSWADVASRYAPVVEERIRAADVASLVRDTVRDRSGRAEIIAALLSRLRREVRYTALHLGDASLVPAAPEETWRRRYGDCKDQATLLAAMLRAAGIPAQVALLSAGDSSDLEPELPSLSAFNHMIVLVPGPEPLYLDPTDAYGGPFDLPPPDQGRQVLVIAPGTAGLSRTPVLPATRNISAETREIRLAEAGPARVIEVSQSRGDQARSYRAFTASRTEQEVRARYEGYVRNTYGARALGRMTHSDPRDAAAPFRLELEAIDTARGYTDDEGASVSMPLGDMLSALPVPLLQEAGKPPRREDLMIQTQHQVEWRYRIVPPPGLVPAALPEDERVALGPAQLVQSFRKEPGGAVTAEFRFSLAERRLSPAQVEAARRAIQAFGEKTAPVVRFTDTGHAHLTAGRIAEALSEYKRLAALHPREWLHATQAAKALLAAGLGEEAQREARRATALDPTSASAQRMLGWTLEHDALGRRFGSGYDRDGARAAYRRAKELDPKDPLARASLAILLEHDRQGRRYADPRDLALAISEYQALRGELDDHDMDSNLAVALFRAGRLPDLLLLLDTLPAETAAQLRSLRVAATAAQRGVPAALAEAERIVRDSAERRDVTESAARDLLMLRRYPEASALMSVAARDAKNAAALQALAATFGLLRRHETLALPAEDPRSVARRLSRGLMLDGQEAALRALLSAPHMQGPAGVDAAVQGLLLGGRSIAIDDSIPLDVALDLSLAVQQQTVDGDERVGYRVSVQSGGARYQLFLVPAEGGPRIAAMGFLPAGMGHEALRHLDAGDLTGARRWLDWAREAAIAQDPLDPHPIARLWLPGSDAARARTAAASLLVAGAPDRALPLLLSGREGSMDPAACDEALIAVYQQRGAAQEALRAAERLEQARPGSQVALQARVAGLGQLGRGEDARRLLDERLRTDGRSRPILALSARLAELAGDHARAERLYERMEQLGVTEAEDRNSRAWNRLFLGPITAEMLEGARRSILGSGEKRVSRSAYHTLAALHAEAGRVAEARQFLLEGIGPAGELREEDWLVIGRIAEELGRNEAAREAYERVRAPAEQVRAISSYALAQRRLRGLPARADARSLAKRGP